MWNSSAFLWSMVFLVGAMHEDEEPIYFDSIPTDISSTIKVEGVVGHPVGFFSIPLDLVAFVQDVQCQTTTGVVISLDIIDKNDKATHGIQVSYLTLTGTYNCTAAIDEIITEWSIFEVIIYGVILTIEPATSLEVIHGEDIEIKCHIQAVPALTNFSWKHDGTEIDDIPLKLNGTLISEYQTLTIPAATFDNKGEYSCSADNNDTEGESDKISVNVIRVILTSPKIEGVVGHTVRFHNVITHLSSVNYVLCQTTTGALIDLDVISHNFMGTFTYGKHVSYLNYTGTCNCTTANNKGITTGSIFDVINFDVKLNIEPAWYFDVIYGEEIEIKCHVEANYSLYDFSWMHNFKPLQSNGSFINENHTLIIPAATSVNSGYYSCRLNIGKTHATSETVSVHVKGAPGVPVISTKRCVVVTQSDNVTLHCNISFYPAASFVYWTKLVNGKEYVIDADGGNLQNPNLMLISVNLNDTGMYTCHAGNLVGNSSGNPTKMSVILASRNMIEGVVGHPVGFLNITTYCFQVNYIRIRCHKKTGEIIYLDMLDVISSDNMETHTYGKHVSYLNYTGTYNCTAENDDGIITGSEFDVIIYGVILTIEPALTFDVTHGEEIQIKCYVQAVPELTGFSWIHNDKSLQSDGALNNGSHTLIIPVATSVNNGQYRCSAENAKTAATSDPVSVNIIGGLPVISTNSQTHVVVHQSEGVTLYCIIDSKPAALFVYWTKQVNGKEYVIDADGGTLNYPSLDFLEAKWSDTGTYICHVGNSFGNATGSAIHLSVISETPMCPCTVDYFQKLLTWNSQNVSNYTKDEWRTVLRPVLLAIEKELRIDVTTVSSFQRKKKSATNKSRSETVMGVVGTIFLAFIFGSVVIIDLLSIKQHLRIIRKMWRRRGKANKNNTKPFS